MRTERSDRDHSVLSPHHSSLVTDTEAGAGVANPVIEASGKNSIISVPRATMRLTPADVARAAPAFVNARLVLLHLEAPVDASLALRLAETDDPRDALAWANAAGAWAVAVAPLRGAAKDDF